MAAHSKADKAAVLATVDHVAYAFDALVHELSAGAQPLGNPPFEDLVCPLFVTWNKVSRNGDARLRGCIGTFDSRPLHSGLKEYALTSALRDRRFSPISLSELSFLRCTVSLLHTFERASSWDDWEIGVHGITIEFFDPMTGQRRSATFLPEVPAHEVWDKSQTLEHLVRKSGCVAGVSAKIRGSLRLTRYQSTTCTLTYEEYVAIKDPKLFRLSKAERQKVGEEAITVPA